MRLKNLNSSLENDGNMKTLFCFMALIFTLAALGRETMASDSSELKEFAEFYSTVHSRDISD